jgi:hypothetical protein
MTQSERALQGYKTRGSQSLVVGFDESAFDQTGSSFFDAFRQGVDLRNYNDLFGYINFKIRSNADPVYSVDSSGNDILYFDDFNAGFSSSFDIKKVKQFFDHRLDRRDLGQIEVFEMKFGPFLDADDPIRRFLKQNDSFIFISSLDLIIERDTNIGGLPLDGFIEPLLIRSEAERSYLGSPFKSNGIRINIDQVEDVYRNSDQIRTGYNVPKSEQDAYDISSLHFLDASEYYGPIDLMPVFAEDFRKVIPFKDRSNDREFLYEKSSLDEEIINVLTISNYTSISDDNMIEFDVMGKNGWSFNEAGGRSIDSLAYGGLSRG